jgi:hypothetical protein
MLNASEGAKLNHIGLGQMDLDKSDVTGHKQSLLWLQRPKKKDVQEYVLLQGMNTVKPDFKMLLQF